MEANRYKQAAYLNPAMIKVCCEQSSNQFPKSPPPFGDPSHRIHVRYVHSTDTTLGTETGASLVISRIRG